MPFTHIRAEGKAGRMGERLMAIVAEGAKGRVYLSPLPEHEAIARKVLPPEAPELDQELPNNPRDFKTPNYGMARWKDLFTPRQLVALTTFSDLVGKAREKVLADAKAHWFGEHARRPPLADGGLGPTAYADTVATHLGETVSKFTAYHCSLGVWRAKEQKTGRAFGRQAIPMVWDFPEASHLRARAVTGMVRATMQRR